MRPWLAFPLLALLAPLVLAAPVVPPAEASLHGASAGVLAAWLGNETSVQEPATEGGSRVTVWFGVRALEAPIDANTTRYVVVNASTWEGPTSFNLTLHATNWSFAQLNATVPSTLTGNASVHYDAWLYETTTNGTVLLATLTGGALTAAIVVPAPAPVIPTSWLIGGGAAVLVIGVGVGAYAIRERNLRRRMRGQARSQVMREMELEQKLEKAKEKDPEQAVVIQQEIRAQEQVREKRRELQILEAKRADVLKNVELLKKRHEMGGLSKHQYDTMVAKRQQDLARIEAEIAEMERADSGAAA